MAANDNTVSTAGPHLTTSANLRSNQRKPSSPIWCGCSIALVVITLGIVIHGLVMNYYGGRSQLNRAIYKVSINNDTVGLLAWQTHQRHELFHLRVSMALKPGQGPALNESTGNSRFVSLTYAIRPNQISDFDNRLKSDLVAVATNKTPSANILEATPSETKDTWVSKLITSNGMCGINGYSVASLILPAIALLIIIFATIVRREQKSGVSCGVAALAIAIFFFEALPLVANP